VRNGSPSITSSLPRVINRASLAPSAGKTDRPDGGRPNFRQEGNVADPELLGDTPASDRLLLTPEEAAAALHVGRTTVYALMKAGELHSVHIGRSCRVSRAELERYVRRLESPAPSASPRPRRHRRTTANQHGLFELTSDPMERS
jgi:excisionase family DNA binding protein